MPVHALRSSEPDFVVVSRAQMDEFARRLQAVEEKQETMNLALQSHLKVFEVLQRAANTKMNFLIGMVLMVILMTMLGPRQGILEFLKRLGP